MYVTRHDGPGVFEGAVVLQVRCDADGLEIQLQHLIRDDDVAAFPAWAAGRNGPLITTE